MKKYLGLKIASGIFLLGATVYAVIFIAGLFTAVDADALLGAALGAILAIPVVAGVYVVGMVLALVGLILARKQRAPIGTFVIELLLPILLMGAYVIVLVTFN